MDRGLRRLANAWRDLDKADRKVVITVAARLQALRLQLRYEDFGEAPPPDDAEVAGDENE